MVLPTRRPARDGKTETGLRERRSSGIAANPDGTVAPTIPAMASAIHRFASKSTPPKSSRGQIQLEVAESETEG